MVDAVAEPVDRALLVTVLLLNDEVTDAVELDETDADEVIADEAVEAEEVMALEPVLVG